MAKHLMLEGHKFPVVSEKISGVTSVAVSWWLNMFSDFGDVGFRVQWDSAFKTAWNNKN